MGGVETAVTLDSAARCVESGDEKVGCRRFESDDAIEREGE